MTLNIFVPRRKLITNITNAQKPTVTFDSVHDFVAYEYVSFRVTQAYGMFEINQKRAQVLAVDDYSIVIDLDTLLFTPFIYPVSGNNTPPQCVPAGSGIELTSIFLPFTILTDAFDNVRA